MKLSNKITLAAIAAAVALIIGAPSVAAAWTPPPAEQEPALPAEGVEALEWGGATWTIRVEPGASEIKQIEPVQEILCGTNYGRPCATTYHLSSTAECVVVQIDWMNGPHNSTDPWRCKPPVTPTPSGSPTPTSSPSSTPSTSPTPEPSPEPSSSPTPSPEPSSTPSEPKPQPSDGSTPTATPTSEPTTTDTTPSSSAATTGPAAPGASAKELAATGFEAAVYVAIGFGALALVYLGIALTHRRRR